MSVMMRVSLVLFNLALLVNPSRAFVVKRHQLASAPRRSTNPDVSTRRIYAATLNDEGVDGAEDPPDASITNVDRRNALFRSGLAAAVGSAAIALGADITNPPSALAADGSAFVGTYSDPINHPGGKRTIRLLESKVGDYQLAKVQGGGGVGEPKNYVLPAVVVGDRSIIIDFSPKGGPRDFTGVLDEKDGSIKFLRDGNRWPRLKE